MIVCNPNMGYAEVEQYSTPWLDFYLNHGINVVLWNYRGYSKSTGVPTPQNLCSDVELVYEWARERTMAESRGLKPIKIGSHGISMGGVPASHLGRLGAIDFLFVDRTFGDLLSFPKRFHPILAPLMQWVTMWHNPDNALNFMYSNCYKVIAQDPRDEIVTDGCSLKTGVAHHILRNELEI